MFKYFFNCSSGVSSSRLTRHPQMGVYREKVQGPAEKPDDF